MSPEELSTEKLLDEYMLDVVYRNNAMKAYQEDLKKQYAKMPLDEIETLLKTSMEQESAYLGINAPQNNFEQFQKEAQRNIVIMHYRDDERVKQIIEATSKQIENINNSSFSEEEKKEKIKLAKEASGLRLDIEYKKHSQDIENKGYKRNFYTSILLERETNVYNRQQVQEEFNINKSDDNLLLFDKNRDVGSCTKSLTISLYKLQEKYGVPIFGNIDKDNIEDIAHPLELSKKLSKYIKKSETGNLEDIDIQKGDIIFLTRQSTGKPGHAMMCHGFDEDGSPLLLGFSNVTKGTKANKDRHGSSRQGIVIDVKSLIEDAIKTKENQKTLSPVSKQTER